MSNLEPIEESDLSLKEKFVGGAETPAERGETAEDGKEKIQSIEGAVERKSPF